MNLTKFDSAEYLTTREAIVAYLGDAVSNEDAYGIMDALSIVTRALGGVPQLAESIGIEESTVQRALQCTAGPDLVAISTVLQRLGVGLTASLVA